jgi:hypothetical protein
MESAMSEIDPIEYGRLTAEVAGLRREVDELRSDIKALLEMANHSRGGLFVGGSIVAALGGVITLVVERFLSR